VHICAKAFSRVTVSNLPNNQNLDTFIIIGKYILNASVVQMKGRISGYVGKDSEMQFPRIRDRLSISMGFQVRIAFACQIM
jgi:hypothetical protein